MKTKNNKNISGKITGWVVGIATIAAVGVGLHYFFSLDTASYTDDAQVQQLLSPVNSRVGGYIRDIRFKEFQKVKKGDTLVIIDNTDYLVQKELAEAGLLDAQAGKNVTETSVNTVQNNVSVSDATLAETRARLWNAEQNYKRFKKLLDQESVTEQQFDQVKSEYDALLARVSAMEASQKSSQLAVSEAGSRVYVNEAAIKRAKAQLEIANLNLKYTIILAPCDGYMGRKTIIEGQLIQQGQQLATVVDNTSKWITANFKEKQFSTVKPGQKVVVKIDAVPGTEFRGTVATSASATGSAFSMVPTDNSTGNFVRIQQRIPVRIEFDPGTGIELLNRLKGGMSAVVYLK